MTPEQLIDDELGRARNRLAHLEGWIESLVTIKARIAAERAEQEKKMAAQQWGQSTVERDRPRQDQVTERFNDEVARWVKDREEYVKMGESMGMNMDNYKETRPKRRKSNKRLAKSVKRK